MYCTKKITDDLTWIGVNNRRLALFENVFPIERGVCYNSYLLKDEKNTLFDTVDINVSAQFLENLEKALNKEKLDYIIINHMEPDHCATLKQVVEKYPEAQIVCNAKTQTMIGQFFDMDIESKTLIIKENDTLSTGKHNLTFVMAPMVHWPEAMVTYDITDKILFSADAFGTFGAITNIFADEVNFETEWLEDARRYYTNIVGKFGPQVQNLLKKASNLEINYICPLHGPVWRENIGWLIDKYQKWSTYEPEDDGVVIFYGSIYGNTENACDILATKLAENGIKNIKMYDVSKIHPSFLLAEAFKYSHLVIASVTYNNGIFSNMQHLLEELLSHNLQNRKVSIIQNGSWAPNVAKDITNIFSQMKNIELLEPTLTIKSSLKNDQEKEIEELAEKIINSMKK